MEPDYNKPASQLFSELSIKLIQETRSLRILSAVRHGWGYAFGWEDISWVPDWNRRSYVTSIAVTQTTAACYVAAAGASVQLSLMLSGRILQLHGFVFDTVDEYSYFAFGNGTRDVSVNQNTGYVRATEQERVYLNSIGAAVNFTIRSKIPASEKIEDLEHIITLSPGII